MLSDLNLQCQSTRKSYVEFETQDALLEHYEIDFSVEMAVGVEECVKRLHHWLQAKKVSCEALRLRSESSSRVVGDMGQVSLLLNRGSDGDRSQMEWRNFSFPGSPTSQLVHLDEENCIKFSVSANFPYVPLAEGTFEVVLPACNIRMKKVTCESIVMTVL